MQKTPFNKYYVICILFVVSFFSAYSFFSTSVVYASGNESTDNVQIVQTVNNTFTATNTTPNNNNSNQTPGAVAATYNSVLEESKIFSEASKAKEDNVQNIFLNTSNISDLYNTFNKYLNTNILNSISQEELIKKENTNLASSTEVLSVEEIKSKEEEKYKVSQHTFEVEDSDPHLRQPIKFLFSNKYFTQNTDSKSVKQIVNFVSSKTGTEFLIDDYKLEDMHSLEKKIDLFGAVVYIFIFCILPLYILTRLFLKLLKF